MGIVGLLAGRALGDRCVGCAEGLRCLSFGLRPFQEVFCFFSFLPFGGLLEGQILVHAHVLRC